MSERMSFDPQNQAEFDAVAGDYDRLHRDSIKMSGEDPEYFARYKLEVLRRVLGEGFARPLLDFGCGIGNLTKHLVEAFPLVHGYDPSSASVKMAQERAPSATFTWDEAQLPAVPFGAIVIANVLHHVPPAEREALLGRVVEKIAPGGKLVVFEHNPWNPLTRKVVRDCPFDADAVLLPPTEIRQRLAAAGLTRVQTRYIVFFPKALAALRGVEPGLAWLPIGAQVAISAERP
jgi:2-polyprenyl-3-methyl-5-hydroxy-6-metoxy-1,4-benzoquinol methylase